MTPERWRQVEEIFQAALDLSPEDRDRYVSDVCAQDTELRRDVESLLSQYDSAGELLEQPVYGNTEMSALESFVEDKDPMLGRRLGTYRIEREIGRGGMGAVYESSRADNEFNKRAAIKLVKRGMDTDFILRRFRKERQILAALTAVLAASLHGPGRLEAQPALGTGAGETNRLVSAIPEIDEPYDEVRDTTRSALTFDNAVMISSAIPSAKKSPSGSALMFVKGNTAIDFVEPPG